PAALAIYTLSLHDALPIYDGNAALLARRPERLPVLVEQRGHLPMPHVAGTVGSREVVIGDPIELGDRRVHVNARPDRGRHQEPRSEEHTSELQSRFDLVCR